MTPSASATERAHDLGLGPGRHVRPADPLPLVVIGHAALLAAVDLHVGGVQVDGDRALDFVGTDLRYFLHGAAGALREALMFGWIILIIVVVVIGTIVAILWGMFIYPNLIEPLVKRGEAVRPADRRRGIRIVPIT